MGNTYWIQTRVGREYSGDSDDLSLIYHFERALDKVCKKRGVTRLCKLSDMTDITYNFDTIDDGLEEEQEPDLDPETGLAYGLDAMEWFDIHLGITTFEALKLAINEGQPSRVPEDDRNRILEDIDYCLNRLRPLEGRNAKFHLAVIM